jgi:hypothetical protein
MSRQTALMAALVVIGLLAVNPAAAAVTPAAAAASMTGSALVRASVSWPVVISKAMSYARTRTAVPLVAPARLAAAGPVPNSAQVYAGSYYAVALYGCPAALPVNNPGIGIGTCGDMADYYGYFQGNAYRPARRLFQPSPVPALGHWVVDPGEL